MYDVIPNPTENETEEVKEEAGGEKQSGESKDKEMRHGGQDGDGEEPSSWGFGPTRAPSRGEPRVVQQQTNEDEWRFGKDHSPSSRLVMSC